MNGASAKISNDLINRLQSTDSLISLKLFPNDDYLRKENVIGLSRFKNLKQFAMGLTAGSAYLEAFNNFNSLP